MMPIERVKFHLKPLVDEILDQLPDHVFASDSNHLSGSCIWWWSIPQGGCDSSCVHVDIQMITFDPESIVANSTTSA
jgi:hypothetical protein